MPAPELLEGVADEAQRLGDFFDAFDWEGTAPDAELQSAEDFLNALEQA